MNVLAVDPGKMSGWALWLDDYFDSSEEDNRFESGEKPHMEFLDWVHWMLVDEISVDAIVCENFIITGQTLKKTRGENWSLEQIGFLRWLAHRVSDSDPCEFVLQSPADAKSFATNDKLRAAGFYSSGEGHANDAARHLLVFIARRDPDLFKELVT